MRGGREDGVNNMTTEVQENKNNLNHLVDVVAIICGLIVYMHFMGFTCYGFPACAYITYEGTIQGDIVDWIYDDCPGNLSLLEILKELFVFVVVFLSVAYIVRFIMRYIIQKMMKEK